ncbi:hypothetical protein RHSIM_Rhsim08G0161600 [Rhododendron simsii]|uniref:Uncharacterized protein n=1 Tax=Rhododendron simsii TaxID=118357 RepID=A0A834GMV6_RHOSS|nr:hypothetical protein RHSIM_Rhsim08G0161600 [Rhododendron simsii]
MSDSVTGFLPQGDAGGAGGAPAGGGGGIGLFIVHKIDWKKQLKKIPAPDTRCKTEGPLDAPKFPEGNNPE